MSEIESARIEFDEAREMLKFVSTEEERKAVEERAWKAYDHLYEIDPTFRDFVDVRRRETEERKNKTRGIQGVVLKDAETQVSQAKTTGRVFTALARKELHEQKARKGTPKKFKVLEPEEIENKLGETFICPICHGPDKGNRIDGLPFCFGCNHDMVPEDEIHKYNRAYRRNWKKRMKKKR